MYQHKGIMQTATDAAALSGAYTLRKKDFDNVNMYALYDAEKNGFDGSRGETRTVNHPPVHGENQKGTSVLEFGIVLLVFFLLTLGIMDIGRAVKEYHSLSFAAREGARYAIVHGDRSSNPATADIIENIVKSRIPNLKDVTVTTTWDPNNAQASRVEVTVEHTFHPIMLIFDFTIPLSATTRMAISY